MSDPSDEIERAQMLIESRRLDSPPENPVTGKETPMSDTELYAVIKNLRG